MIIDIDEKGLLELAEEYQMEVLIEQGRIKKSSIPYMVPETFPSIGSSQVLGLIRALAELLGKGKKRGCNCG